MTDRKHGEDRTAAWMRAHPRLTSLGLIILVIGIFALIGLRVMSKVTGSGDGTMGGPYVIKLVAIVGGALFIVWRANRRLRKH